MAMISNTKSILIKLSQSKLFFVGLVLRLALIFYYTPIVTDTLFVPFLNNAASGDILSPWASHLDQGGEPSSFPYGIVMYAFLMSTQILFEIIQSFTQITFASVVSITLVLLVFDFALCVSLINLDTKSLTYYLKFYWLSPLVIFVNYIHGQLDVVPIALLLVSLIYLKAGRPGLSAILLTCAISAKMSIVIALPFILLFLLLRKRERRHLFTFLGYFCISVVVLFVPTLFSDDFIHMVYTTPVISKVFDLKVQLGTSKTIFVIPMLYLLTIYVMWSVKKINYDLFFAFLGAGFTIFVLFSDSPVGWYLWLVPFLLVAIRDGADRHKILFIIFSLFIALRYFSKELDTLGYSLSSLIEEYLGEFLFLLKFYDSIIISIGLILTLVVIRDHIFGSDFYKLSKKPLMVSISGDSGSGKDTLVDLCKNLFTNSSISNVSGDDYHLWDRSKPMWKHLTHLNPRANDLPKFKDDIIQLSSGKAIRSRHYDHSNGKLTTYRTLHPGDVILVSGLHALYDIKLNSRFDIKVYLDMDESLRRFFKVKRDVLERGHTLKRTLGSIKHRALDREKYVLSQRARADIVFKLLPVNKLPELQVCNLSFEPRLQLLLELESSIPYQKFVKSLIVICGAHVDTDIVEDGRIAIKIEGDISQNDIEAAAKYILDRRSIYLFEFKNCCGGIDGVMQLAVAWLSEEILINRLH
jgi:uridine kinase